MDQNGNSSRPCEARVKCLYTVNVIASPSPSLASPPMSASPPPPPYSEFESESPVPCCPEQPFASSSHTRDTPSTFRVGHRDLCGPLVQIKHLKLHLLFLSALHDLRRRVESSSEGSLPPLIGELDGEQRWSWFVYLAVERQVTHIYELDIWVHDPLTWTAGE